MTKHLETAIESGDRPALETEITEGMVEAGIEVFADYDPSVDSLGPVLREAFGAMMRVGREVGVR